MKHFLLTIAALLFFTLPSFAQTPKPTPTPTKSTLTAVKGKGSKSVLKGIGFVLTNPVKDIRAILTPPLVAVQVATDVTHDGFAAADKATGVGSGKVFGAIHFFFHGADVVTGKADEWADDVEQFAGLPVPVD